MKSALQKSLEYAEKFIQPIGNSRVPEYIRKIINEERISSIIDLGCGDGILIYELKREFPKIKITGIDISPRRIKGLKKRFPKEKFYCRDVCNTKIKDKFNMVHCSQVIEHVENDRELISEMKKLLKKNGILVVSSVIKRSFAIYKYWNKGKFVLDPSHEREYKNQKEFLNLFKEDFILIKSWVVPVKRRFILSEIKIPGYYLVYGIWKKRK